MTLTQEQTDVKMHFLQFHSSPNGTSNPPNSINTGIYVTVRGGDECDLLESVWLPPEVELSWVTNDTVRETGKYETHEVVQILEKNGTYG